MYFNYNNTREKELKDIQIVFSPMTRSETKRMRTNSINKIIFIFNVLRAKLLNQKGIVKCLCRF